MTIVPIQDRKNGHIGPVYIQLAVDEEFRSLIPPLKASEIEGLEKSILRSGCKEPITVWNGVIVDGHHRYDICTRHKLPFKTFDENFTDRAAAKLWMVENQRSRRNLSASEMIWMVRQVKDEVEADARERQETTQFGTVVQNSTPPEDELGKTRDILGKKAGVSGFTFANGDAVYRDGPQWLQDMYRDAALSTNGAHGIMKALQAAPDAVGQYVEDSVLSYDEETLKVNADKVKVLARLAKNNSDSYDEIVRSGWLQMEGETDGESVEFWTSGVPEIERVLNAKSREHTRLARHKEWQEPGKYTNLVLEVLGEIDLNPAADDSLDDEWVGRMFLNPPLARIEKFVDKLCTSEAVTEAILLVQKGTDAKWFIRAAKSASAFCFTSHVFLYYGDDPKRFGEVFASQGVILVHI